MVETTLALAALLTMGVGVTYAYVGLRLARQAHGDAPSARAMLFFRIWWLATALNQISGGALYLMSALGRSDLDVQLAYVVVQRLLLAISLVGLMHYLVYLQTGRPHLGVLIGLYSAYWVASIYNIMWRVPVGVESFGWRTDLVYERPQVAAWGLLSLVIVIPPVVGALLLLRVYRRVEGRERRLRIAMLSIGFAAWWLVAVFAGQARTFDVVWFQIANRLLGAAVALGILFAFQPTAWMRRRYHLERQALS